MQEIKIEPGDVLTMAADHIPLPYFNAAVDSVENGKFSVFSTQLSVFQLGQDDVTFDLSKENFTVLDVRPAAEAVPGESRGFNKGDRLITAIEGQPVEGNLVAAFDGILVCHTDDGRKINGGAAFFGKIGPEQNE